MFCNFAPPKLQGFAELLRAEHQLFLQFQEYTMEPIDLSKYHYDLPEAHIAKFPVTPRDRSKLLHYANGTLSHHSFFQLPDLIPENSTLFFNNTKVIPARIFFQKPTGGVIQVFLLHPVAPSVHVNDAMTVQGECVWECTIGNLKRWNDGLELSIELPNGEGILYAELLDRSAKTVRLRWDASLTFAEMLVRIGEVPLPPYLNREPIASDKETYQTVYSKQDGAVAAPTAGLHFTKEVLEKLKSKGVEQQEVTLHVSAGTFQPIKVENVAEHPMHTEQVLVTKENVKACLQAKKIVVVGTTSMRTLESLYWYGAMLCQAKDISQEIPFKVEKLVAYEMPRPLPSRQEALDAVLRYMEQHNLERLAGETGIFIFPGYPFALCDGIITNFHQPGSTLILLVGAFIGEDWRKIYQSALANDYRFLSYGDSSLIWRNAE